MGLFSEINKFFKKAEREVKRVAKQGEQAFIREPKRVGEQILRATGLARPEFPPPPPLPPLAPPPATRITGQASDEIRRRQRRGVSGRRKTIVTGELSPTQVGKKTLLGR